MLYLIRRFAAAFALAAVVTALVTSSRATAHEGHDHGPPQQELPTVAAPRAEAQSDSFELVAVARDGALTIYVDRFHTNEPVIGASVEIETPEGPKLAPPVADRYLLKGAWAAAPGFHDLLITVTYGDVVDVLTTTLTVSNPDPASAGASRAPADLTVRMMPGPISGAPSSPSWPSLFSPELSWRSSRAPAIAGCSWLRWAWSQ